MAAAKFQTIDRDGFEDRVYRLYYHQVPIHTHTHTPSGRDCYGGPCDIVFSIGAGSEPCGQVRLLGRGLGPQRWPHFDRVRELRHILLLALPDQNETDLECAQASEYGMLVP